LLTYHLNTHFIFFFLLLLLFLLLNKITKGVFGYF
jgi:hypothetical protein